MAQIIFNWLLRTYAKLFDTVYDPWRIQMHYTVKADHPGVGFNVVVGEVVDSEGNVIENPALSFSVMSSNPNVVSVASENGVGNASFGSPGSASVIVEVRDANTGNLLASGGDTFTVTVGDPAAIASIETNFEGLTPTVEALIEGDPLQPELPYPDPEAETAGEQPITETSGEEPSGLEGGDGEPTPSEDHPIV